MITLPAAGGAMQDADPRWIGALDENCLHQQPLAIICTLVYKHYRYPRRVRERGARSAEDLAVY